VKRVDYGLDAPGVILGCIGLGLAVTMLTLLSGTLRDFVGFGAAILGMGVVTYASSRWGKLAIRDRVLDALSLRGDERVLDVGCGRGLLLVGAAKRLSTGKALGVDLWSRADQLDNRREVTLANAAAEGVANRVEVVDGDMRKMPFDTASFDVIVSNLAIHNVPGDAGRRQSIIEIVRVLRAGGRVVIIDLAFTKAYAQWLAEGGLVGIRREWPARWFFPPLGIVSAEKRRDDGE
jgi:cyclopropane fatty-acyl-phospholipid synthase-like methyltransferase